MNIHQVLHGYDNGHRRLAGSIDLPALDSELIDRLSDLSGPLFGSVEFRSYFTGYPLPSGHYYALARTWLDEEASRAGSVLTHTLLVSKEQIAEIVDFGPLVKLLHEKPYNVKSEYYREPLHVQPHILSQPVPAGIERRVAVEFIYKYFGEERRPILWLDATSPINLVNCIFRGLWPRLRYQFAFCTFSLQLRHLNDRPFDLLFTSSIRLNKHHQLPRKNVLISSNENAFLNSSEGEPQEWLDDCTAMFFFSENSTSSLRQDFSDLWYYLETKPTVIPRLFRLRELMKRLDNSPTAAIGAMDLVGSLVPERGEAVPYKTKLVTTAIELNESLSSSDQSLKNLFLISERAKQKAFQDVERIVSKRIIDSVAANTMNAPQIAFNLGKQLISERAESSPYVTGFARGLAAVVRQKPSVLLDMEPSVTTVPAILVLQPSLAVTFFEITRSLTDADKASKELATGIYKIEDEDDRHRIREALISDVAAYGDVIVLGELLRLLPESAVSSSLNQIREATNDFVPEAIRQEVIIKVSDKFPLSVQKWGQELKNWSFGLAAVVAASFPKDSSGLERALSYSLRYDWEPIFLAAYFDSLAEFEFPDWLEERLASDPNVFLRLLVNGVEDAPEACSIIERILVEVPKIAFTLNQTLLEIVNRYQKIVFGEQLVDIVIGNVITQYVVGQLDDRDYNQWCDTDFGKKWFSSTPYHRLSTLIVNKEPSEWERAWFVVEKAPDTLYLRKAHVVHKLVNDLLDKVPEYWSDGINTKWTSIIVRAKKAGNPELYFLLCGQALGYSLKNPHLPLSGLVVVAFPVVYKRTVEGSSTSSLDWFFYFFSDWDKGKELRRQLISAFLRAKWPPEDLALAMPDQKTFRKMFKRLHRQHGGQRFIQQMAAGLKLSKDPRANEMYRALKELIDGPDFDEPWI